MKSQQFLAARATTAAAISAAFLQLWEQGKPFPEGVELMPNGTGYFDKTVDAFKGVAPDRNVVYATKDQYGRKVLAVPVRNFGALRNSGQFQEGQALVFFERNRGGADIVIEQLTMYNNVDQTQTFKMAALIADVGDWLI